MIRFNDTLDLASFTWQKSTSNFEEQSHKARVIIINHRANLIIQKIYDWNFGLNLLFTSHLIIAPCSKLYYHEDEASSMEEKCPFVLGSKLSKMIKDDNVIRLGDDCAICDELERRILKFRLGLS